MKKKFLCLYMILLSISCLCYSQKKLTTDLNRGCSFTNQVIITDNLYGFNPSPEALEIINKIVNELGLKVNFVIQAVSIDNACAVVDKGVRYIYYSENFIQSINLQAKTNWSGVFILAHEIGHHLNGHTLDTVNNAIIRKEYELEADEFAANILGRFGASLSEAQSAIQLAIAENQVAANYPPKIARMEAVAVGWQKGKNAFIKPVTDNESLVKDCIAKNTGDYYFKNTTQKRLRVRLYILRDPYDNVGPAVRLPNGQDLPVKRVIWNTITVAPGKTGYYQNITVGTWTMDVCEITPDKTYNPANYFRTDCIQIEKCVGKTYILK
jgi:hypothetical protein